FSARLVDLRRHTSPDGKTAFSKRVQFLIQDLLDLRSAEWMKKLFKEQAKTKEDIRKADNDEEVQHDEELNENQADGNVDEHEERQQNDNEKVAEVEAEVFGDQEQGYVVRKSEVFGDVVVFTNLEDDRYKIADGCEGTHGVFRGTCSILGQIEPVVIKVWEQPRFKNMTESKKRIQELIKKEVEILKKCSSDHVVQILEYTPDPIRCQLGTWWFLVMEHAGISLAHFCENKNPPLEKEDRLHISEQLFDAFMHIHEKNIIHRDVKPDNILVSHRRGCIIVKLCDFGLAKICGGKDDVAASLKASTRGIGTNGWMAPEVIGYDVGAQRDKYNQTTDIWGLGCVIFWLHSSFKQPFKDNQQVSRSADARRMESLLKGDSDRLVLHHPTAFALVRIMIVYRPENRASLTDARTHPFFWDYSTAKSIVKDSWTAMNAGIDQSAVDLKDHFIRKTAARFKAEPWTQRPHGLPASSTILDYINVLNYKPTLNQGQSGFELLAALRHIIAHPRDWPRDRSDYRVFNHGLESILLKDYSFMLLQIWDSSRKRGRSIDMSFIRGSGIRWEWRGLALSPR
ncbi:unnamed protein product, partial [Polarella glacialis]